MRLRILITNAWLARRSGSELYVSDIARALLDRGHLPIVYSTVLGPLADDLRARTIPVIDDLAMLADPPDIIHGHHNRQLMTALLHFSGVPAVRVCHGWYDERPQPFPRIHRVVCVDWTVRDRVVSEWGVPESHVQVLLNFVDLSKFPSRGPLPEKPVRALVFSNQAATHLPAIRSACEPLGIQVDAVGVSVRNVAHDPGTLLASYDLVFAKARCALEAMAVGNAVILCDEAGLGPIVTPANFEELRAYNFGLRTLRDAVTPENISRELAKYSATGADGVSRLVRTTASMDSAVDGLLAIYDEVLAAHRAATPNLEEELRAAAAYLRSLEPDHTLKAQTRGFLKAVYHRAARHSLLRLLLPTRAWAKRIDASMRRS